MVVGKGVTPVAGLEPEATSPVEAAVGRAVTGVEIGVEGVGWGVVSVSKVGGMEEPMGSVAEVPDGPVGGAPPEQSAVTVTVTVSRLAMA